MWKRLLARCHPDSGGACDLFVWATALREHVAGDSHVDVRSAHERREPPRHPTTSSASDRLDFTRAHDVGGFEELTRRALRVADEVEEPYAGLLRILADCVEAPASDIALGRQQAQGATYRTLARIAYEASMSKAQRVQWYEVCRSIPLSQRHAGHILHKLTQAAA